MPTDVSTALPESDYTRGTVVRVTMSDPNSVITGIVLHGFQAGPVAEPADDPVVPLYSYQRAGGESPGGPAR